MENILRELEELRIKYHQSEESRHKLEDMDFPQFVRHKEKPHNNVSKTGGMSGNGRNAQTEI